MLQKLEGGPTLFIQDSAIYSLICRDPSIQYISTTGCPTPTHLEMHLFCWCVAVHQLSLRPARYLPKYLQSVTKMETDNK